MPVDRSRLVEIARTKPIARGTLTRLNGAGTIGLQRIGRYVTGRKHLIVVTGRDPSGRLVRGSLRIVLK